MYLDTIIAVLFIAFLLYRYVKTKALGNLGFIVPLIMVMLLNTGFPQVLPPWGFVIYRIAIIASCVLAFVFYIKDFRRREAQAIAVAEKEREKQKAERQAKQKAANAHPNPSKKKAKRK